jgi:hypothetical protein
MIMYLRLQLVPGHGVVVQFIRSNPLVPHVPSVQPRFLVDVPTPHVLEQVVHSDHRVQVPTVSRFHECIENEKV